MPRHPQKPVTLTALQRVHSAQERAQTFRELADRMNPDARARLREKAAQWDEVARLESKGLEKAGHETGDETVDIPGPAEA